MLSLNSTLSPRKSFRGDRIKSPNLFENLRSKTLRSATDSEYSESIQSVESGSVTETRKKIHKFANLRKKYLNRSKDLMKVDEEINAEHLRQLQWIFLNSSRSAGSGKVEGLSIEQFRNAMKKTIARDISDDELEKMFMKMDANSDGTLEWNEYISYLLLEYQERQMMLAYDQDTPFPYPMEMLERSHVDAVCRIAMLEGYNARFSKTGVNEPDDSSSRWLTLSRDASLTIWNKEWLSHKTFLLEGPKSVTDMVCMSNCNTIAVSSTDYEITFYAIMPHNAQRRFQIRDLKHCALSMDYGFNINDPNRAILVWGDSSGSIVVIRFCINPNLCLFTSPPPVCINNTVALSKLLSGSLSGIQAAIFKQIHNDWVKKVSYFKSRQGQESVISCCVSGQSAVFFADVTEKNRDLAEFNVTKPQFGWTTHFRIAKGILCLTYDPELNLIATGSNDNRVRVWNPHVMQKSMAVLKGHACAITYVISRVSEHQIISISKDNNVRVWDLQDFTCKQNIHGRSVNLGPSQISAAYFNNRHKELIIATSKIGIFKPHFPTLGLNKLPLPKSHQKPVVKILYNKLYNLLVTGGEDAIISLWDLKTGEKTMQFSAGDKDGISFMTFDSSQRRLLAGGYNGEAAMWNFNNGEKLKTLDRMEKGIADGIFTRDQIMIAGLNKRIRIYMDDQELDTFHMFKEDHADEISCMDFHQKDQILASSSYNGDIYIWSIERAIVTMTFNMFESIIPINRVSMKKNPKITLIHKKKSSYQSKYSQSDHTRSELRRSRSPTRAARPEENEGKNSVNIKLLPAYLPWLKANAQKRLSGNIDESYESEEKFNQDEKGDDQFPDLNARSVYKILFLQTRRCEETIGSLFSLNSQGYICIWSIHHRGGLLGFFQGCRKKGTDDLVTAMATDSENTILVTGDSRGYIRCWNISKYYNGEMTQNLQNIRQIYTKQMSQVEVVPTTADTLPLEITPKLLLTYRGHMATITSVVYIDKHDLIASGGKDRTIRLWTHAGRYIGTFGQPQRWQIQFPIDLEKLPRNVPEDLQGVASVKTLCVAKGIPYSNWQRIKNLNRLLQGLGFSLSSKLKNETASTTTLNTGSLLPNPDTRKVKSEQTHDEKRVKVKDALKELINAELKEGEELQQRSFDKIEQTFLRIQEEGMKSSILGKINYKPKKRHKLARIKATIKWSDKHPIVYNSLPFEQLQQPELPEKPQISFEDYPPKRRSPPGVAKKTANEKPLLPKREKELANKL